MKPLVSLALLNVFNALMATVRAQMRFALKAQGYAITHPDIKTLSLLHKHPGMSLQKLVALTGKDKAQITRKIKELERKNLVCRQKDVTDQRSYQLFLTPQGRQVQIKAKAIRTQVYQHIFANLTAGQQQQMAELMQKCLENGDITVDSVE